MKRSSCVILKGIMVKAFELKLEQMTKMMLFISGSGYYVRKSSRLGKFSEFLKIITLIQISYSLCNRIIQDKDFRSTVNQVRPDLKSQIRNKKSIYEADREERVTVIEESQWIHSSDLERLHGSFMWHKLGRGWITALVRGQYNSLEQSNQEKNQGGISEKEKKIRSQEKLERKKELLEFGMESSE